MTIIHDITMNARNDIYPENSAVISGVQRDREQQRDTKGERYKSTTDMDRYRQR